MSFTISKTGSDSLRIKRGDGATRRSTFETEDSVRKITKFLGVDANWLEACVVDFKSSGEESKEYPLRRPVVEGPPAPVPVWVRGLRESERLQCETFEEALRLETLPPEALIEWQGEGLAALDVDFHAVPYECRPSPEELDASLPRLTPLAPYTWSTHGRGVRCVFTSRGRHTAAELAAAAFLSARNLWPMAEGEIKTSTRHPASESKGRRCGPVRRGEGGIDLTPFASTLTNTVASEAAVEAWLEGKGFRVGERYPHDRCVIAPSTQGGRDPVFVTPHGVYCHYCAGTTGRGFRSFRTLAGTVSASILGAMVKGFVHWGHAKHLLASLLDMEGEIARLCYSAALKCLHEDDERIKKVFDPSLHYVRFDGYWATGEGQALTADIGPILAELPACGTLARVAEFRQPVSLERFGYFPVLPVWGCRIASVHPFAAPADRTSVVFYPPELRSSLRAAFRPRYLAPSIRGDVETAWREIEKVFPGLNRAYLQLLIAAKGCAESGGGRHPMIYVSGCTAAAKTATVQVAASICGDVVSSMQYQPNPERRGQAILAAKERGTFCLCNEVTKDGADAGKNAVQTMTYILGIEETAQTHKMYVGQVQIGSLPVFVWTDTTLPEEIRLHAQIARRLTWVDLPQRVEWEPSLLATGVGKPDRLRLSSDEHAHACNVILSDIIDRFFTEPPNFDAIAAELGFQRVEEKENVAANERILSFFHALCAAPEAARDVREKIGPGWREIRPEHETELSRAWDVVRDQHNEFASRLVEERDLRRILGTDVAVKFETKRYGKRFFVRFAGIDGRINAELQVGLEPLASRVDRSGDAIDGGHFAGFKSLSGASFDASPLPGGEG